MKEYTNAYLGRVATGVVEDVSNSFAQTHYVNKTDKYVSVKVVHRHLTEDELADAELMLRSKFPKRFLKIYNAWAWDHRAQYMFTSDQVDVYPSNLYREPKVLVRFTQE